MCRKDDRSAIEITRAKWIFFSQIRERFQHGVHAFQKRRVALKASQEPGSSRALRFVIHMLGIVDSGIGPAGDSAVNDRQPQAREETG